MLHVFKQHIEQNFTELLTSKTLLTVSGGVDSMVLLHLFQQLDLNFAVAHCNFQLRSEASDLDEKLVYEYCLENQLCFYSKSFDTASYVSLHKVSIQIGARELRYQWFNDLSIEISADFIATAHHLDDQVETFLINFTRGTGVDGLVGIPEKNGKIIRPLLPFSRDEILKYAHENNITWREDASNASVKYLRNKMRHVIVPVLKNENSAFLKSFQDTLLHLKQTQFLASEAVKHFKKQCILSHNGVFTIDLEKTKVFENSFIYLTSFLKEFYFDKPLEIQKIVDADTGKLLKNHKYTLLKNRSSLVVFENNNENAVNYCISSIENFNYSQFIVNTLEVHAISHISDKNTIFVDADLLKFPIALRKRKEGDVFQPFGFNGFKKVSKFFKDEKLSILEKQNQWILENADQQIIWIVGLRADDRFKVTSNTSKIYKLTTNQ